MTRILVTVLAGGVLAGILGWLLLPVLRALKAGQSIREVGPTWHNNKAGTPMMGGLFFIFASILCVLGNVIVMQDYTVLYVLALSLCFGLVGFLDDFCKAKYKRNLDLTSIQKALLQMAVSAIFVYILYKQGTLNCDIYVPFFNVTFYIHPLLYVFFAKSKDSILEIMEESGAYIDGVLWIWTAVVAVSALLPACYTDGYFYSFAGHSFRLMPASLIIMALAMYMAVSREDKRYNLFLIMPLYGAFMGKSRTYFAVCLIFVVMYLYMQTREKRNFYFGMVPLLGLVLLLMSVSSIADKIKATQYTDSSYYDFWGTVTNGRTVFWKWDLEAFFNLPLWRQFLGNGFNFVYDVNGAHMEKIWAHNDVINILMNFGYIGLAIYFWAFWEMLRSFWPREAEIPGFVKLLFLGTVAFNSMLNMSYTYLCAMIAYPLFLCVISAKYETAEEEGCEELWEIC